VGAAEEPHRLQPRRDRRWLPDRSGNQAWEKPMKAMYLSIVAISVSLLACAGEDPDPGGEGRESADFRGGDDVPAPTEEDLGEPIADSQAEEDGYGLIYAKEWTYPTNYYGGKYTSYNMTSYCQKYIYPWSYGSSHCEYLGIWNNKYQYNCITTCYI
jgi:hypothetical protein